MSNEANWVTIGIACLLLLAGGIWLGYALGYALDNPATIEVPGATIVKEVPVEVIKEVPTIEKVDRDWLGEAQTTLFEEEGDDDDFLTCKGHEFDEDEVSISRTDKWGYVYLDDDEYKVWFKSVFEFQDDSDERDCKEHRTYSVHYEDDEDPEIEIDGPTA